MGWKGKFCLESLQLICSVPYFCPVQAEKMLPVQPLWKGLIFKNWELKTDIFFSTWKHNCDVPNRGYVGLVVTWGSHSVIHPTCMFQCCPLCRAVCIMFHDCFRTNSSFLSVFSIHCTKCSNNFC